MSGSRAYPGLAPKRARDMPADVTTATDCAAVGGVNAQRAGSHGAIGGLFILSTTTPIANLPACYRPPR
jgi:hypothetical protein